MTQHMREISMFGETVEVMEKMKPECVGNAMYATMILSDAQTVLEHGDKETARQFINKAKFFITKEGK